jgi:hypothetical protein
MSLIPKGLGLFQFGSPAHLVIWRCIGFVLSVPYFCFVFVFAVHLPSFENLIVW